MCIQWTRVLYSVVITWQSTPPISQFNNPCNEFTSVWWVCVYNNKNIKLCNVLSNTIKSRGSYSKLWNFILQLVMQSSIQDFTTTASLMEPILIAVIVHLERYVRVVQSLECVHINIAMNEVTYRCSYIIKFS